jgi:hypothetical protein
MFATTFSPIFGNVNLLFTDREFKNWAQGFSGGSMGLKAHESSALWGKAFRLGRPLASY